MSDERVLRDAEFNRNVCVYWLLSGTLILTITVFGIVLVPFWLAGGMFLTERYLRRMRCTLTERSLKVSKGLLIRVEKTVPLDKITDVGLIQGPIMRAFNIESLSIETAGQSSAGALVSLTGIRGGRAFRDAILEQRDLVVATASAATSGPPGGSIDGTATTDSQQLMREIRDCLLRLERRLGEGK